MKYRKQIVTEGLYVAGDGKKGRVPVVINKDRLQHWVDQHKKMKEVGLDIPAPNAHKNEANPASKTDPNAWFNKDGKTNNWGFWDDLEVVKTTNPSGNEVYALEGVLDVPLEEDQKQIGKTVKSTSIYAKPEFVDGHGNEWKDVLTHIFVGNQTIEPGQTNFTPLPVENASDLAISMSHIVEMSTPISTAFGDNESLGVGDLFQMLRDVAGLDIPDGTPDEMIKSALMAALRQKQLSETQKGEGGTLSSPPKDSNIQQVPIVMSNNQPGVDQQSAPQEGVVSMSTVEDLQTKHNGLLSHLASTKRDTLRQRLGLLKQRGIIDDTSITSLTQEIDGVISMSFDENQKEIKSSIETKIEALEMVKPSVNLKAEQPVVAMATEVDGNLQIEPQQIPTGPTEKPSEDQVNELFSNIFSDTTI